MENPLDAIAIGSLLSLDSNGSIFTVKHFESKDLPKPLLDWAFNLFEMNMRTMYEDCDWGWKPKEKMKELTARKARFLIAYNQSHELPVAFVHFRFDKDYGRKVVYCYELHLEPGVRGNKIGSWLMKILEVLGTNSNHTRVVLTVLKANTDAIKFYKKIGYDLDETSPGKSEGRPYFIYSKPVPPPGGQV